MLCCVVMAHVKILLVHHRRTTRQRTMPVVITTEAAYLHYIFFVFRAQLIQAMENHMRWFRRVRTRVVYFVHSHAWWAAILSVLFGPCPAWCRPRSTRSCRPVKIFVRFFTLLEFAESYFISIMHACASMRIELMVVLNMLIGILCWREHVFREQNTTSASSFMFNAQSVHWLLLLFRTNQHICKWYETLTETHPEVWIDEEKTHKHARPSRMLVIANFNQDTFIQNREHILQHTPWRWHYYDDARKYGKIGMWKMNG